MSRSKKNAKSKLKLENSVRPSELRNADRRTNWLEDSSLSSGLEEGSLALADQYRELADRMSARGEIKFAVPFYRQALVMVIEERDRLRRLLIESGRLVGGENREDELRRSPGVIDESGVDVDLNDAAAPGGLCVGFDLQAAIAELGEGLTPESARQVLAGLQEFLDLASVDAMPSSGHSLKGKALVCLGKIDEALDSFAAALQVEPAVPQHAINLAGAFLLQSRYQDALPLLRPLYQSHLDCLDKEERRALLGNLASAESMDGNFLVALRLRRLLLSMGSEAFPVGRWIEFGRQGLTAEKGTELRVEAVAFLAELRRLFPGDREVCEALAQALESQGDNRQAALLYRDLLR